MHAIALHSSEGKPSPTSQADHYKSRLIFIDLYCASDWVAAFWACLPAEVHSLGNATHSIPIRSYHQRRSLSLSQEPEHQHSRHTTMPATRSEFSLNTSWPGHRLQLGISLLLLLRRRRLLLLCLHSRSCCIEVELFILPLWQ